VDVAEFAYGRVGRTATVVVLCVAQIGIACGYLIFVGTNIMQFWHANSWLVFAACCGVVTLLCFLPSLEALAPTSYLAQLSMWTVCILILLSGAVGTATMHPLSELTMVRPALIPVFFGIACQAFVVHGMILNIEGEMATPKHFFRMLDSVLLVVTLIYLAVGGMAYVFFGETISSEVTNSMALVLPTKLINVVELCLCFALICTTPIMFYPVFSVLEAPFTKPGQGRPAWVFVFRAVLVLCTGALAKSVPFFGMFASLSGGLSLCTLAFILPPLFFLRVPIFLSSACAHIALTYLSLVSSYRSWRTSTTASRPRSTDWDKGWSPACATTSRKWANCLALPATASSSLVRAAITCRLLMLEFHL
jgi:hypothetical protein